MLHSECILDDSFLLTNRRRRSTSSPSVMFFVDENEKNRLVNYNDSSQ